MSVPKVSVIVPMYNTEAFLPICVESIRGQTLSDIEIILVDDASPDACGWMADEYAKKDPRIKVVHHDINKGLGPARNTGISVACGEYVGFVDSDDWVEPKMFERLYSSGAGLCADVVFGGRKWISGNRVIRVLEHPFAGCVFRGEREIFQLRRAFYGFGFGEERACCVSITVCTAVYRRAFLRETGITFENIYAEDRFFNTSVCCAARVAACISGSDYCYRREGQESITNSFDATTAGKVLRFLNCLVRDAKGESEAYREECLIRAYRSAIDFSRALIGLIESSDLNRHEKHSYAQTIFCDSTIKEACLNYPLRYLPATKAFFCLCQRMKLVSPVLLLAWVNRAIKNLNGISRQSLRG